MGLSRVFLCSDIWIYWIEDRDPWAKNIASLMERLALRRDLVLTSTLTLGEVLVHPYAHGATDLAQKYERALTSEGARLLNFDAKAAHHYALIRQDKTIKPPDAIQLAVAAAAHCDLFITNDERLSRKIVPGIQFISSLDRVPV
jgi:predicted nucleic acid-binding protein